MISVVCITDIEVVLHLRATEIWSLPGLLFSHNLQKPEYDDTIKQNLFESYHMSSPWPSDSFLFLSFPCSSLASFVLV